VSDEAVLDDPEPTEITYDEQFYPARPRRLRPYVRRVVSEIVGQESGAADATDAVYVAWLTENSMLHDANLLARQLAGQGSMWQNPFAQPNPRAAIDRASVWFTAYPLSLITVANTSYLATLGDDKLWESFAEVGIDAVHTGPVKQAGGLRGWTRTPSVDGHFDRTSMQIDRAFGTEEEFRHLCGTAAAHGGLVIDDIVPGHTGKGPDFRLAEMRVGEYPGIYHMVEIAEEDWDLLPPAHPGADSFNLTAEEEANLEQAGYIIGQLQRVIFHEPGVKDTNWSATAPVLGVDGTTRRWVYLHYFKAGQPSVNWLDPSCAGMRLVIGDACHSLADLGSGALRLDANGFLGAEKSVGGQPGWSEGHPLSEAANHLIASIVRKMGGFTFQELNLSMDDIKVTGESGADLSYDFVNRPAYHHALVTGSTEFLRLTLNASLALGVHAVSLVHALQNHDELTYELVHFATRHRDDEFTFGGRTHTGLELAECIRADLLAGLTGPAGPYNRTFTTNGIACTTASVITAALGFTELDAMDVDAVERVKQAHLLLAMFNALQPGVFALSGWDLCGVLPLDPDAIHDLVAQGDTRWINRGAHDLTGASPDAAQSAVGMPRGRALYGSLPAQLDDEDSFARRLQRILEVRKDYGIASADQIDVPAVAHPGLLVMVHRLPDGRIQATVLNFSSDILGVSVHSEFFPAHATVRELGTDSELATVDELHNFPLTLAPHHGLALVMDVTPLPA
jgi:trehalose synthase